MRLFSFLSRERPDEELRPTPRRAKKVARLLAVVAILAALMLLTVPQFQVQIVQFSKDRPMDETVVAEFDFAVEDRDRMARERAAVPLQAGKLYSFDRGILDAIEKKLETLVALTGRFERENEDRSSQERADYAKLSEDIVKDRELRIHLSSPTLQILSREIRSARFSKSLNSMYRQLYSDWTIVEPTYSDDWLTRAVRIKPDPDEPALAKAPPPSKTLVYPGQVRDKLRRTYLPRFYPLESASSGYAMFDALRELALAFAEPNLTFNPEATKERIKELRSAIQPVHFLKGDPIVRAGEELDDFSVKALSEYNASIRSRARYYRVLRFGACLVLALGMLLFLVLYARRFRPLVPFRTSTIVIVGVPLLVVLVFGQASMALLGEPYRDAAGYLFPAALVGMLGVILLDVELGIIVVLMCSVLVGLATNMSFHHALPALFGGMTAVASLHRLRQRGQLFRAAIYVALVNVLAIAVLRLIDDPTTIYYSAVVWGTINAALCYLLAIGMFPLFEGIFGITTDLKLLEITGVHHPLIRELEEKAPGSYQHSLNVAKLAEAAAEAIGANYLLVRAGAYFHDIGKTLKPRYFSENQVSPEERRTHERLTPYMSCLIIRNHIKEGIELARRYGLSEKVIDFIPQHHGTCLIKYFYHEAIRQYEESESAEPVRESDFRYPGPKPQSIEAAIVMVADSVEATATSRLIRPNIDADDIRRLVMDAIQDKFSDGQFDDCHLTLRQLHEIRESMVRTLLGRFHYRIDYPSPTAVPGKKALKEPAVA